MVQFESILVPGIGVAKFLYFEELQKTQEEEGFRAANCLTKRHIDFNQKKLKLSWQHNYSARQLRKHFVLPEFWIFLVRETLNQPSTCVLQ